MKIKQMNTLDIAILIAIFEFFALFFVALLGVEKTIDGTPLVRLVCGLLIGVLTTVPALLVFNYSPLKLRIAGRVIKKLKIWSFTSANAIFLGVSFYIEAWISSLKLINIVVGNLIVGFVTMFLTVFVLVSLYNRQKIKLQVFDKKWKKLKSVSWFSLAVYVAVLEALVLPLMALLLTISFNIAWFAIAGSVSGFVGVGLATIIYNKLLSKKLAIKIAF